LITIKHAKKKSALAIAMTLILAFLLTGCAAGVTTESTDEVVPTSSLQSESSSEEGQNDSDVKESGESNLVTALSWSDIDPYEAPEVETTEADSSDIASVIVSYVCNDGTEIMFYTAQNGDIFGAYETDDGAVMQFTQGYWATGGGYQEGYGIEPYEDVFGHDGFYIVCPRGTAYVAYDYYYFNADGTLKLLIQCSNYVIEDDIDGDGEKELQWFYHGTADDQGNAGAGMAFYGFERDGQIYEADLNSVLGTAFPDISFPGCYLINDDDSSVLYFEYHLSGDDDNTREFELKFTADSLMVYSETERDSTSDI